MGQKVAILGASQKPERYSYKAFHMLEEYGHTPLQVDRDSSLGEIKDKVDTLTVYVNPQISSRLKPEILKLNPKRVIFNPGSENPELQSALTKAGIHVVEACTLVLLRTNQFDNA